MLLYLKTQNGAEVFLIAQYDVRRKNEKGNNCSPRSTQIRSGNSLNLLLSCVERQIDRRATLFGYGLWLEVVFFQIFGIYIGHCIWGWKSVQLAQWVVSDTQTKCLDGIAKLSQYQKLTSNDFVKIQRLLSKGKRFLVPRWSNLYAKVTREAINTSPSFCGIFLKKRRDWEVYFLTQMNKYEGVCLGINHFGGT